MLFPTHLLAAYLVSRASRLSPVGLVAGAALPDVVDKPLATVGVTDTFHSVGHSGVVFLAFVVFTALVARSGVAPGRDVPLAPGIVALAVGWGSHLLLDALHVVINGRPESALFLGWPLVVPTDPLGLAPVPFFFYYLWSPSFFLEVALWLSFAVVVGRSLVVERSEGSVR